MEVTRESMLALFTKNMEEARTRLSSKDPELSHHVLVDAEYNMGMLLCDDGGTLRLVPLQGACRNLLTFERMENAQRARLHWNSRLNDAQREAGCALRARTLRHALEMHAVKMGNLVDFYKGSTN